MIESIRKIILMRFRASGTWKESQLSACEALLVHRLQSSTFIAQRTKLAFTLRWRQPGMAHTLTALTTFFTSESSALWLLSDAERRLPASLSCSKRLNLFLHAPIALERNSSRMFKEISRSTGNLLRTQTNDEKLISFSYPIGNPFGSSQPRKGS